MNDQMNKNVDVCPVEVAGMLDNKFRKLFQDPQKIMKPYIKEGMVVLDLGCVDLQTFTGHKVKLLS